MTRRRLATVAGRLLVLAVTVAAVVVLARTVDGADLAQRLREADPRWIAAAALASLVPIAGNVASMTALTPVRLPVGWTTLVWLATSFANLLTPSSTGGVALTVRYLQQRGMAVAAALATIGVVQSTSALVSGALVLGGLVTAGRALAPAEVPWPVLLVVVLAAAALAGVLRASRRAREVVRARVVAPLRELWPRMRRVLTSPGRLLVALAGHVAVPLGFAVTLACAVRAAGEASPPLLLLVLVVVGSSAVTVAVPVPGGVGASEAALTAGLVAVGVAPAAALSAALLHRFLTFWVRVPPAWAALLWLRRRRFV
ncbi:lysylphosphatidylglycerol synthase transmembrane domain-containing protein [Kineococcus terrestris]|uniref:lysylphosphatidylglycerol synthase transmembrane domain-containing protein n=1 Tax=Kineococcus terrestris TaxID=2044856 RepID=UPI0034DB5E02